MALELAPPRPRAPATPRPRAPAPPRPRDARARTRARPRARPRAPAPPGRSVGWLVGAPPPKEWPAKGLADCCLAGRASQDSAPRPARFAGARLASAAGGCQASPAERLASQGLADCQRISEYFTPGEKAGCQRISDYCGPRRPAINGFRSMGLPTDFELMQVWGDGQLSSDFGFVQA